MSDTPIKVGIIGFGRSGCNIHANAIAKMQDRFIITAICDEIPERRTHEAFPDAKSKRFSPTKRISSAQSTAT